MRYEYRYIMHKCRCKSGNRKRCCMSHEYQCISADEMLVANKLLKIQGVKDRKVFFKPKNRKSLY